jgi:DinB family protein
MTDREFRALGPPPRSPSGRPQPGEYAAYAHPDISRIPEDDAVAALRSSRDRLVALFSPLTDARVAGVRYAPGKWTIKDLLGHLSDDERIYAYRALRLARTDDRVLAGFDQVRYAEAAGSEARPLTDLVEEYRSVRTASITLFDGLGPEAWTRRGTLEGHDVTVRGLAFHIVGHEMHHLRMLRDRYLPLVSPA